MIGEIHALAGIDAGHVTGEATRHGRDGTGNPRLGLMAVQTGGLIGSAVRGSSGVGIVAVDAAQSTGARLVTLRLHDPDRLEPGQRRKLGPESAGEGLGRMAMALAAKRHLGLRRPAAGTEWHRQLGSAGAGGRHVRRPRAVTALARDVGDHLAGLQHVSSRGRDARGVAAEACARLPVRQHSTARRRAGIGLAGALTGRHIKDVVRRVMSEPVFECGKPTSNRQGSRRWSRGGPIRRRNRSRTARPPRRSTTE